MKKKFSHLTKNGEPTMVDVSDKEISHRLAVARSVVIVAPEILEQFLMGFLLWFGFLYSQNFNQFGHKF